MNSAAPLLEVRGLAAATNSARLFSGVQLELHPGETVAVQGPSGCGKTTLLRTIAGLIDPAEGEVRLRGKSPGSIGWPAYRRQVVLVNQRPTLLDGTLRDNLERPFRYASVQRTFPEDEARRGLERLGLLPEHWEQEARSLSVGEQQRACILRAWLLKPAVLLLDEPTSALDQESAAVVEALIQDHAEEDAGVLMVSHDPAQAERLAGGVVDLRPYLDRKRAIPNTESPHAGTSH